MPQMQQRKQTWWLHWTVFWRNGHVTSSGLNFDTPEVCWYWVLDSKPREGAEPQNRWRAHIHHTIMQWIAAYRVSGIITRTARNRSIIGSITLHCKFTSWAFYLSQKMLWTTAHHLPIIIKNSLVFQQQPPKNKNHVLLPKHPPSPLPAPFCDLLPQSLLLRLLCQISNDLREVIQTQHTLPMAWSSTDFNIPELKRCIFWHRF